MLLCCGIRQCLRGLWHISKKSQELHSFLEGQRKVDEKSNQITAIPELLKFLAIAGCIVTIDAIGTQTALAKTVVDRGVDYFSSENQGHLYENISVLFAVDQAQNFKYVSFDYHKTVNNGHGRSYRDAGRANYRTFELAGDTIYPILCTLFFALLVTWRTILNLGDPTVLRGEISCLHG